MMMVRRNGTIVTSWCHTLNQVQGYTPSISWSEFMLAPPIFQCMVSCRSRSRGKVETDFRGVLRFGSVDCSFTVTAWINLYGDQTSRYPTPLFPPMERIFDCGERLRIWSPWLTGFASMCACMVRYGRTLGRSYGIFATT